jgi:glucose 1-dehydrogenase
MTVKDKVAIITGAGQGIGFEIARKLSSCGASVVLNDEDADLCHAATKSIGRSCVAVPGDASDSDIIRQMIDTAVSTFGKLDIAIANAGITLFGEFLEYDADSFSRVMQVNLGGTFFLAQAAARQMKLQSSGGSLLFMSSVTGHQAHKHLAAYGMTKAAIEMLARNLVIEVSPFGINVNAVAPGATLTQRTVEDKEYESTWSGLTPMGRPATVQDIAGAAVFLVSDEARQITGQTLIVDGGWTCISPSPF